MRARPLVVSVLLAATFPGANASRATLTGKLDCVGLGSSKGQPPPKEYTVVFGVVAVPASPRYLYALQTSRTGDEGYRLFAKSGLWFKTGSQFELGVPAALWGHAALGWGNPGAPAEQATMAKCPSHPHEWMALPGGFWTDNRRCLPVVITSGKKAATVRIGLGIPCAGQKPPTGLSEP